MPPFPEPDFVVELVFAAVMFVLCYAIYRRTRESYELTKHQGIKYFRESFLLFGLSYVMSFLLSLTMLSTEAFDFFPMRHDFGLSSIFIFLMSYFSTLAIFYLLFSSLWKKLSDKSLLVGHSAAAILSFVAAFTRSHVIVLLIQSVVLVIAAASTLFARGSKKLTATKVTYLLVFGLWLVNLWIINPGPDFALKPVLEVASAVVLLIVYLRVSKWTK